MPNPQRTAEPTQDLGREAEVTETDKRIAPRFWASYATPLFRALLNAVREK